MQREDVFLMSSERVREQLTGKRALLLAQAAFDAERYPDAQRLLSIAHDLFAADLPPGYVSDYAAEQ